MKTKEERIKEQEAKLKEIQEELKAIRNEPELPKLKIKDKHVYRRKNNSIMFAFDDGCGGFRVINSGDATSYGYCLDGCPKGFSKRSPIVECIGKIGVVRETSDLDFTSDEAGTYGFPTAYDPNNLTGKVVY